METKKKTGSRGVTVLVYGSEQKFSSRKAAIDFFTEAMFATEGAESERYKDIVIQLMAGWKYVRG